MPHDLFEEITTPTTRVRGRSPYTLIGSIAAHVVVIGAVVIVPLLAVDKLPTPSDSIDDIWIAAAPLPLPPPPARSSTREPRPKADDPSAPTRDVPTEMPDGIHDPVDPAPSFVPTIGNSVGSPYGVIESVGEGVGRPEPPAPPPPPTRPLPVGGQIREPQKVFSVAPAYPAIARAARISGTVVIVAVIGVDGQVRETRIQSSVPLLDQSALDAVRQWRYRPTLLNGVPVPVIMTVSVRFTLE